MLHMAAAMAVGCYSCMQLYHSQMEKEGLTDDELQAIEAIVMAVSGGRVMMQHKDASGADMGKMIDTLLHG